MYNTSKESINVTLVTKDHINPFLLIFYSLLHFVVASNNVKVFIQYDIH